MALNNSCIHSPSPHIHINKAAVVSSSNAFNWANNGHTLLAARCFWLFSQIAGIMRDFFPFFWCFIFLALSKLWLAIHYYYKLRSTDVSSRKKEATRCCYRKPECSVGETHYFSLAFMPSCTLLAHLHFCIYFFFPLSHFPLRTDCNTDADVTVGQD